MWGCFFAEVAHTVNINDHHVLMLVIDSRNVTSFRGMATVHAPCDM
jgi:hypothetical protein